MIIKTFEGIIADKYHCTDMSTDQMIDFCKRKVYEDNKIVYIFSDTKRNGTIRIKGEYTGRGDVSIYMGASQGFLVYDWTLLEG